MKEEAVMGFGIQDEYSGVVLRKYTRIPTRKTYNYELIRGHEVRNVKPQTKNLKQYVPI